MHAARLAGYRVGCSIGAATRRQDRWQIKQNPAYELAYVCKYYRFKRFNSIVKN